jgi:hypothetical protein
MFQTMHGSGVSVFLRCGIAAFTLAMLVAVCGCKKNSSPVDASATNTPVATKSAKRGIAYDIASLADLAALSKGLSWWYNWGTNRSSNLPDPFWKTYGMDFIPMLWGGNSSESDIGTVESYLNAHPEVQYLLVMNEPNLIDQANRTPAQAATDWLKYERVVSDLAASGRTVFIVGPAMNWGTMSGYSDPVTWLDAFYAAYEAANGGREPKIDYLAFHWYDYGLGGQLDRLKKYGKKIWITEMANWNSQINSYAKQKVQMQSMVDTCETRDDVFRYAWFIGRGSSPDSHYTYLFTSDDGVLNDLGEYYIDLPFVK